MAETLIAPPPGFELVTAPPPPPSGFELVSRPNVALQQHFQQYAPRAAESFGDYLSAGWQSSVTGLATRGKRPEVTLTSDSPWYGHLAAMFPSVAGDLPAMVAGFSIGAPAGAAVGSAVPVLGTAAGAVVGGWAGGGALPAGLRTAMMEMYASGDADSSVGFISSALKVAWETAKGGIVGGVTGGAGRFVQGAVQPGSLALARGVQGAVQPMTAKTIAAVSAAEITSMATVGAGLEGRLPEPQDFLNAGVMVGGMKLAGTVAGKMRTIYAKTGIRPEQVAVDAKADPRIALDLKPVEKPLAEAVVDAWHGSPYKFEKFDASKIGTGEGAQAYGHGLYLAENPDVAGSYKIAGKPTTFQSIEYGGEVYQNGTMRAQTLFDVQQQGRAAVLRRLDSEIERNATYAPDHAELLKSEAEFVKTVNPDAVKINGLGNLYKVQIPQRVVDRMLDWDKPLSEQPSVLALVKRMFGEQGQPERWSGKDAYEAIAADRKVRGQGGYGTDTEAASKFLADSGITGIRYLDQGSRAEGKGTRNFVVFDPNDVTVVQRNGVEIPRAYEPAVAAEKVRNAVPDAMTDERHAVNIAAVMTNLEGKIPENKTPNYINFRYVESAEDVKAISARVSEIFEKEIVDRRQAPKGWDQSMEEARKALADSLGKDPATIERGSVSLDAEILAKNAIVQKAAADVAATAANIRQKGIAATEQDFREQVAAIETLALVQAEAQGASAEVARALNVMKAARQSAELAGNITELLAKYNHDPHILARMIGEMENAGQISKFAREATKATKWDMVVEAYKAGIIGPVSQVANVIGNLSFIATHDIIDVLASMRPGGEIKMAQPAARIIGQFHGAYEGLKIAADFLGENWKQPMEALRKLDQPAIKMEQHKKAIPGDLGVLVRGLSFPWLTAADGAFRMISEYGEKYSYAAGKAMGEGFNPATREFRERMAWHSENIPKAVADKIQDFVTRSVFQNPLGAWGKQLQSVIKDSKVGSLFIPFTQTPSNVFKEMARLFPPSAPFVEAWRKDIAAGGASRDRAIAEIVVGGSVMGIMAGLAAQGNVTGYGPTDAGKRRLWLLTKQPYSVKIGDTWHSYDRIQPIGTLIGFAADMVEIYDYMSFEEKDKVPKMISIAFSQAVTNQVWLRGIVDIGRGVAESERYGPKIAQNLAASMLPGSGWIGQTAAILDPYMREVDSILEAIRNKIPIVREGLMEKTDPFGGPIKSRERAGIVSPIQKTKESEDKVITEAARLGVSVAKTPKKLDVISGFGKLGEFEMTPEQRQVYARTSGQLAHNVLSVAVNSPTWKSMPDLVKKRYYENVFRSAHEIGGDLALPSDVRAGAARQAIEKIMTKLRQPEIAQ